MILFAIISFASLHPKQQYDSADGRTEPVFLTGLAYLAAIDGSTRTSAATRSSYLEDISVSLSGLAVFYSSLDPFFGPESFADLLPTLCPK